MLKLHRVIFVLFLTLLFFEKNCFLCYGMVVNPPGFGGGVEGDPAPGRSPGPPKILVPHVVKTLEDTEPTVLQLPEAADGADCSLQGNVVDDPHGAVNFSIGHELFKTELLVPGIIYQVTVASVKDIFPLEFTIVAVIDEEPNGQFSGPKFLDLTCPPHIFRGLLESSSVLRFNWTYNENRSLEDKTNVTFQLKYRKIEDHSLMYKRVFVRQIIKDCRLWLRSDEASVSWKDFPRLGDCQTWFPGHEERRGVAIILLRLNVPCERGHLHFSGLNTSQHQNIRTHKQAHLCGKLEELSDSDRHIYFPSSHTAPFLHLHGNPTFAFSYRTVDYCYNMTFTTRNGSFELKPSDDLECTFKIYLPYGNRVALTLQIGDSTSTEIPNTTVDFQEHKGGDLKCEGLLTQLVDAESAWWHCTSPGDAEKQIQILSRENKVVLRVSVRSSSGNALGLRMFYKAEPVDEIVGRCGFGWIALRQFCISTFETSKLPWIQAEMECTRKGGHLISIRNEYAQNLVNNLLLNSPGYKDHNAYWIGATDKTLEGDFRWSDGLPFSYANWFPGWSQHGNYNRQPNDDGLSEQDCVEVRRVYSLQTSPARLSNGFMWNDRDCAAPNYFICERLQSEEPLEDNWPPDCNRSVILSRQQSRTSATSPSFPRQYPDNVFCETEVSAPSGYRLILDFEELVLESEPSCSYDYLEIVENFTNSSALNNSEPGRRLCGDWSSKLKLLRYVSKGSKLKLRFSSDYSHHFGGFKARVSMENVMQCSDDRLQMFNNSCYLFVSYPEVTWSTAQQICMGIKAQLTSVLTPEEEKFISSNIRKNSEYRTSAIYWFGAQSGTNGKFYWVDGTAMSYTGWLPNNIPEESNAVNNPICLGVQWMSAPTSSLPSGLYWNPIKCEAVGGYVCKRPNQVLGFGINFNKTVNGSEGQLTTPNYPENYYNNLDFCVKIVGPERTRIVIHFERLDIETQLECLYDYVQLRNENKQHGETAKWCGSHETEMHKFDFVSDGNEAILEFHSDYSISGGGFLLHWHAVDVSGCPAQTLTTKEGTLISPNYPQFLLPHLDCSITILAPTGKRVWLEFQEFHVANVATDDQINESGRELLQVKLGPQRSIFKPYQIHGLVSEGTFISNGERMQVTLKTAERPRGKGFKAIYKIMGVMEADRVIHLKNDSGGVLMHLNYPNSPSPNINFVQHLMAPLGYSISLEVHHVKLSESECTTNHGVIEIYDNYADSNGTHWYLCYKEDDNSLVPQSPIALTSYLNTLHVRQKSHDVGVPFNASLKVKYDGNYKAKLLKFRDGTVEVCTRNPCLHGGRCIEKGNKQFCQCLGYYTGLFCALTQCELEPCIYGKCELTANNYKCHCKPGYVGTNCDQKQRPCEGNPCESRGVCVEKGNSFHCRCHAWWEGPRCERRMMRIPYKPLSERMLEEPFWLGLITVTVVMGVIGLVWCAKRHFPEKIEKLLAEDSERNVPSLRTSLREQLAASGTSAVTVTPSPGPGVPRSLFGRLGTPSPRKRRNNSTPTKKNAAEKKQILQQLVTPSGNKHVSKKVSLGELIQLTERKGKDGGDKLDVFGPMKETKLLVDSPSIVLNDPKLEKKVTFARLLSKVSAEMSSGSEMELGIMHANRLGCAFARPSSTPPSPAPDARSPNSTSSNQGSDTFSGSDLALPSTFSYSISDLVNNRKHSKLPNGRQKPASADSILAMFRNFSSSSAGINLSNSLKVTPSTTPTASSPQDDIAGDDDSSTSSIHTPISFTSAAPESPSLHRQSPGTIEVPVLDMLSAHKSSSNGSNLLHPPTILLEIPSTINKCLSPIRELPTPLPTPMPSPAITPLMHRSTASSSINDISIDSSDDRISIEIPNISISDDDEILHCPDIVIDPQAEDGLIMEEAAVLQQSTQIPQFKFKVRPPPGTMSLSITSSDGARSRPPPLVIPTLIVQTPSPTRQKTPPHLLGSPPPHRSEYKPETNFPFNSYKQSRKTLKEFDKPTSLDLPYNPPMITITCNMSEAESDIESISPAPKSAEHLGASSGGMCYLSPFAMGSRGDRTTSESNLSSSGYSSMASPGPSRCGSSNPLCPSEMEDPGPPGPGSTNLHPSLGRRPSPLLKSSCNSEECSKLENSNNQGGRGRSDSETLSDDPLIESNDEGIGTDHLDEKIEDGELKSAKELEVFITAECDNAKTLVDLPSITNLGPRVAKCASLEANIDHFLPPSTTYGLYDFPSTDKVNVTSSSHQHRKSTGRRREKRSLRQLKALSPTKIVVPNLAQFHLDVPGHKIISPRKPSPKRRTRTQLFSSSSSSDSVASARDVRYSSSTPSPDTIRWSSSTDWLNNTEHRSLEASGEDTGDEREAVTHPKSLEDLPKPHKISRLKVISNQIRFLRRMELGLKKRERAISPSESGEDSPRATSPLLQPSREPRPEIRKSSSIGRLHSHFSSSNVKNKRGNYKRGELLIPHDDNSWKRVVSTGNGYSD